MASNFTLHQSDQLYDTMQPQAERQDDVLKLKAALNEKEMELIELREQHMQLVGRSKQARENWETALMSKDRAIAQLEEALEARQRQLELDQESDWQQREQQLEDALNDARAKNAALQRELSEQRRQLSMMQASTEEFHRHGVRASVSSNGPALESLKDELNLLQQRQLSGDEERRGLQQKAEEMKAALSERDKQLASVSQQNMMLREEVERLQDQLASTRKQLDISLHATDSRQMQLQEKTKASSDMAQQLQQRLDKVHVQLTGKAASARKYKQAVRLLKAKLIQVESASVTLHKQLLESQSATRDAAAKSVDLTAALEKLKLEVMTCRDELKEKDEMMSKTLAKLERAEQDKDNLEAKAHAALRAEREATRKSKEDEAAANRAANDFERLRERLDDAEAAHRQTATDRDAAMRRADDLSHKLQEAEKRLKDTSRSDDLLFESERQVQEARRKAFLLESRAEEAEVRLAESTKQCGLLEQRFEKAERLARDLESEFTNAERRAKQAESRVTSLERRAQEAESWSAECESRAKEAEVKGSEMDQRAKDADRRCKLAEARSKELERTLVDAESRASSVDRKLRDCEAELREATEKLRDLEQATRAAEAAAKQVRVERNEVASDSSELRQLRAELQRLQSIQQADGGSAQRAAVTARISSLEELLALRERTITQLKEARVTLEADHGKEVRSLMADLQAKNVELIDAERRFHALEAVMQRIAARCENPWTV